MNSDAFDEEVDRARRQYDDYQARGCYDRDWVAFDEGEAAHRSQQALAMAKLMREAGFGDLRAMRILDVGCGRGRHVRGFVDLGADPRDVQGIDVHEPSIELARSLSPHLQLSLFDGQKIPFPDESFDLVTQHVVFSSIAVTDLHRRLADEMVRVLAPGGYVYWWDTLRLSRFADAKRPTLDVRELFHGLPIRDLQIGQKPTPGRFVRLPLRGSRLVQGVLDRLPIINDPPTHTAALIGPKP